MPESDSPTTSDQQLSRLITQGREFYGHPQPTEYSHKTLADYYRRVSGSKLFRSTGQPQTLHFAINGQRYGQADVVLGWLPVNGRVLELGCGPGSNLAYLQQHVAGQQWSGIDLSPVHIKQAKKYCQPGTDLQVADFSALPYDDNSCALIYAIESLCHAPDPAQALADAQRCLAPGGALIVFDAWRAEQQSAVERQAQAITDAAACIHNSQPQQVWRQAASDLGLSLVRAEDYTAQIRAAAQEMAAEAQQQMLSGRRRAKGQLFGPGGFHGALALLLEPMFAREALHYGLLVWEKE